MTDPADLEGSPDAAPVPPPAEPIVIPPAEPVASAPPEPGLYPMSFTGSGAEYFRIWIVNLALTIVTLGVYSAWAKVRRLQYFYRHTRLAGAGFDYHGDPVAILKGRLVGLALFGLYYSVGYVQFPVAVGILSVLALALPWLLSRSLKFRLHNSSYRGIRFRFSGSTRSAYWVFLALPMLTVLSLFLVGPLWHHRIKRYEFANAAYGRTPFTFLAEAGDFYITYVIAVGVMFAFVVVMVIGMVGVGVAAAIAAGGPQADPQAPSGFVMALTVVILFMYALAIVAIQAITTARVHNTVWNGTKLGSHGFICEVSWARLFWIQLSNLLATVLTIGLFRPFAQVRLSRYLASAFVLVPGGALDGMLAADAEDVSAVGEETAGFFDLDIGF